MSNYAVTWVNERSTYRGGKYTLHLVLADTAGDPDFELWGRQQYFADKARIDRARCCLYLKEMVAEGTLLLLEDHSKRRKPNRYRMLLPDGTPKVFDCKNGSYARNMPTFDERAEAAVGTCAPTAHVPTCAPTQHVEIDKDPSCALAQHEHVRSAQLDMCAEATQNPSSNPSSNENKTARHDVGGQPEVDGGEGAVASDRARVENSDSSSSLPRFEAKAEGAGYTGETNAGVSDMAGTLFGSVGSGADAPVSPPDSGGPPHGDVARVVGHLAAAVVAHRGERVDTGNWGFHVDLLLRRGPVGGSRPLSADVVVEVIDWVFGPGAVPDDVGECWAGQVRSAEALRRNWVAVEGARGVGALIPPVRRRGPAGAGDPDFERFWKLAPKWSPNHVDSRQDVFALWRKALREATAGEILVGWEAWTSTWAGWPEESRRFVPSERTWLLQCRWRRPVPVVSLVSDGPRRGGGQSVDERLAVNRQLREEREGRVGVVEGREVVGPVSHTPVRRAAG